MADIEYRVVDICGNHALIFNGIGNPHIHFANSGDGPNDLFQRKIGFVDLTHAVMGPAGS